MGKHLMRKMRVLLMFAAIIGSASYALADGGGGEEGVNCCAKAADCKEVDNASRCDSANPCSGTYSHCCPSTCPPVNG